VPFCLFPGAFQVSKRVVLANCHFAQDLNEVRQVEWGFWLENCTPWWGDIYY
jgi:hypothetical protein